MARPLRIEFPEALYHVTDRGIEKKDIFRMISDKQAVLKRMIAASEKYGFVFYAYCIMDNHYHLLFKTPFGNLSRGMQNLKSTYAQWYNERHDRCGPLFQGRFKAYLIEEERYLLAAARYIVLNPVKAGIVRSASAYTWSSYGYMMGKKGCPGFLDAGHVLECLSPDPSIARRMFRGFTKQGLNEEEPDYLEKAVAAGSKTFVKAAAEEVAVSGKMDDEEISRKERFFNRPTLDSLFAEARDRHFREARNARIQSRFSAVRL